MSGRAVDRFSDAALESALRDLAPALAWPEARPSPGAPDVAMRVRSRIVAGEGVRRPVRLGAGWGPIGSRAGWRPMRRGLVLALAALLVLAAVAAAVAFGVPGIRLSFGTPVATPPPSIAPVDPSARPGAGLRLGRLVSVDAVAGEVPFPVGMPSDPLAGPPDAAWVSIREEVTLTWGPSAELPPTIDPDVGLLLTQFRGSHSPGLITKVIDSGTKVERVTVDGAPGFWIAGDPHFSFYETPEGEFVEETRRWVGDALIWADGEVTYRLETSLGREAAMRIASSVE